MKVLLTRPLHQSQRVQRYLQALSISSDLLPLYEVVHKAATFPSHVEAFVLTSQEAVPALGAYPEKDVPVFTVGDQTAKAVRRQGFSQVISAAGNGEDLERLILREKPRSLLYLSGDIIRRDLQKNLEKQSIQCDRQIVYQTILREEDILVDPSITHVMFFSPRTAQIFGRLVKTECSSLTALCMSQAVEREAKVINWGQVWIAPAPTLQGMMGYFYDRTAERNIQKHR